MAIDMTKKQTSHHASDYYRMENVEKGDKLFPVFVLYYKRVILWVNLTGQREIVAHEP